MLETSSHNRVFTTHSSLHVSEALSKFSDLRSGRGDGKYVVKYDQSELSMPMWRIPIGYYFGQCGEILGPELYLAAVYFT
jgi:hypothetical protein